MAAEFKSFAEMLRAKAEEPPASQPPVLSPFIAQPPAEPASANADRLQAAQQEERFERALSRLLEEIAAEVVGRELLLAPVDVAAIAARLRRRYRFPDDAAVVAEDGDVTIVARAAGSIDASLGRRVRAAIDRALE